MVSTLDSHPADPGSIPLTSSYFFLFSLVISQKNLVLSIKKSKTQLKNCSFNFIILSFLCMHISHIMKKRSHKVWVISVCYRFILEQCVQYVSFCQNYRSKQSPQIQQVLGIQRIKRVTNVFFCYKYPFFVCVKTMFDLKLVLFWGLVVRDGVISVKRLFKKTIHYLAAKTPNSFELGVLLDMEGSSELKRMA